MGKKRKRSKGEDPAAEVIRPLVVAHPAHTDADAAPGRGTAPMDGPPDDASRLPGRLGGRAGAQLCYGDPVVVGERTVIPVAVVHTLGGWGHRHRGYQADAGGDEGRLLNARPIGYIEVSADGSRYVSLGSRGRLSSVLVTGLAALAGGVLAALVLRRGRR